MIPSVILYGNKQAAGTNFMNKILYVLLIISILTPLSGLQNYGDTVSGDILKEYELPSIKRQAWNEIKEKWIKNHYRSCLKKFRLKMTCGNCTYIYMKAVITVDNNKRLTGYSKTGENVCGRKITPALEKCLMEPLEQKTFPDDLKNSEFETMLGTGLKC